MRLVKIAVGLGVLALLGVAGWLHAKKALDTYFNRGTVLAPSVVGRSLEEAVQLSPLTVRIASHINSSDIPAGHVVAQEPPPGTPVHANTPVRVVLSRGTDLVEVPVLTGQSLRKAKLLLSDARLGLGQLCTLSSERPRDTVVAQYPAIGGRLGKGGLVDLLVSAGPTTAPKIMPRLLGLDEARARGLLERHGLARIDTIERPADGGQPPGAVLEQDPAPGAALPPDPRVLLTVARSPATDAASTAPAKHLTFDFTMPPGLTAKRLDVYQSEDRQNRRSIHSADHQPGERVPLAIDGSGAIEVEFYVDNVAYGIERF